MKKIDNNTFFAVVEEQLRDGKVKITAVGKSMQPAVREGEDIVIEAVSGNLTVGEVYLFRYFGEHRLHRLRAIDRGGRCVMRGDACFESEYISVGDIVGHLVSTERAGDTANRRWRCMSLWSVHVGNVKRVVHRFLLTAEGRRHVSPWYFALLAFLMWAPLNGLGVPLDNYILGLRADHLIHASVYLPCALMLWDVSPRRKWVSWLLSVAVGIVTESVQWLLPWRGFDINDMVANALGASLGWFLCKWLLLREK